MRRRQGSGYPESPSGEIRNAAARAAREAVITALREAGLRNEFVNVVIEGGVLHLWGWVESATERQAAALAARRTPGVRRVENHLSVMPARVIGARGSQ